MKIKALIDCNGLGYECLEAGEVREVSKEVAALLISFGYAAREEMQSKGADKRKKVDEKPDDSEDQAAEVDEKP